MKEKTFPLKCDPELLRHLKVLAASVDQSLHDFIIDILTSIASEGIDATRSARKIADQYAVIPLEK